MISSKAAHPNCMYKWMDWITSPEVNAQVAEYFGEAPAQTKACEHTTETDFCDIFHATDAHYAAQIHYWTTPQKKCVDGSGDNCTTYDQWVTKWQQIKG
jgi:putative spermidine/putrescine transport system substrate-binding protein